MGGTEVELVYSLLHFLEHLYITGDFKLAFESLSHVLHVFSFN